MKLNKPLLLLTIASGAALVLGTAGFYALDASQGWLTCLYKAAQLFSMGSGVVDGKETPLLIEISRWLALCALLGAVFATLRALLSDLWNTLRLSSLREHAIVCGAGNRGSQIARAFARSGNRKVVVIELDEHNPSLGELRNLAEGDGVEVHVLVGNALDETVLVQAGVRKARTLVAVTGHDEKNLSICAEAEKMSPSCELSAGIESWAWRSYYLDRLRSRIRLDSYVIRAARNLTLEMASDAAKETRFRAEGVRILIEASPNARQELVRAAALNFQICGDRRPILELTAATEEEIFTFNDRFPAASLVVDIRWHTQTASRAFPEEHGSFADYAIFALEDDIRTLEAAERCWMRSTIPSTRVQACVNSESDSLEMPAVERRSVDFEIRNIFKLGLGTKDPMELSIEKRAQVCHSVYFRNEQRKDPSYGTSAGHLPAEWRKLPERYRESNRLLAMHHEVKRIAWENRGQTPAMEILRHLSRCEHMRWMAEKAMDGWRWSGSSEKTSRDNLKLKHNLLIPYDALKDPEKDKDYNSFLWALNIPDEQLASFDLAEDVKQTAMEQRRFSLESTALEQN